MNKGIRSNAPHETAPFLFKAIFASSSINAGSIAGTAAVLIAAGAGIFHRLDDQAIRTSGRADAALAAKCGEVARLERQLFQADEPAVLEQCLIQYRDAGGGGTKTIPARG